MKYEVDETHPFFEQMAMYILLLAGSSGTLNMFQLLEKIVRFQNGEPNIFNDKIQLHTGSVTLNLKNNKGKTTIRDFHEWISYIAAYKTERPQKILFETDFSSIHTDKKSSRKSIGDGTIEKASFLIKQATCTAIGMAYESIKERLIDRFDKNPTDWPVEFQFFRHARNASFHGNIFDIRFYKGQNPIDTSNPPEWRIYTLPSSDINGSKFVNDYFPYHMTLPFLAEIGSKIASL